MGRGTDKEQNEGPTRDQAQRQEGELTTHNPRPLIVDDISAKRRDEIAAGLLSFYEFLVDMYLPYDALKRPPEDGWSYVTPERFAFLGKTDIVLDIYKHIPYICYDEEDGFIVSRDSICIDYTGKVFRRAVMFQNPDAVEPDLFYGKDEPIWDRLKDSKHIAILALASKPRTGTYIALDTRDGRAAHLKPSDEVSNVNAYESENLRELLVDIKQNLIRLDYIPLSPTEIIYSHNTGFLDKEVVRFKETYGKHGWTSDHFNKEACMTELKQHYDAWLESRRREREEQQNRPV